MTLYVGSNKIKDTGTYGVYFCPGKTNCLTYTPKNINLELTYGAWTQPVLTANGTLGGDSFAVALSSTSNNQPAYMAFDGNADTSLRTGNDQPSWVTMYNPVPLKVTKIHYVQNEANFWATELDIQASKTGADNTWVTLKSFTGLARYGDYTWDINTNDVGYKYYRIYIKAASRTDTAYAPRPVQINTIELTATALNTLVLKKGSKVYVPNGKNVDGSLKFDEVVIASDINFTYTYAPSTNTQVMLFINNTGTASVYTRIVADCFSGTTQPSGNYRNWYNTTENKMYSIGNNATIEGSSFSLPIAIITQSSSGVTTSIDQIFDWCGYIGSTTFVLPKVKGLIPNGWNSDGTYKSIEFETSEVLTYTLPVRTDNGLYLVLSTWGLDYWGLSTFTSGTRPSTPTNYTRWYNKDTNYWEQYTDVNGWEIVPAFICGEFNTSSGTITSLTPYTAQPAMTVIPINAIYNGSEKVYQYHPYNIGEVLLYGADTGTKTYTLPKGVYQCCVVGGGRTQPYWTRPSGAAAEIMFRLTQPTNVEVYSGGIGVTAYLKINGVTVVTCTGSTSDSVAGQYTIDTSSSYYVSTVMSSNGIVSPGLNGASVSPYEEWGKGNTAGGARLAYVGA